MKHVHTSRVCTGCFNLKINLVFYAVPVSEFLPDDSICSVQLDEKCRFREASEKLLKSAAAHLLESQALSRMAAISSGNRGAAGTRGMCPVGFLGSSLMFLGKRD